ncbi:MAG TPA: peptidylprolyl isomerase [Gemmatimonadales bacterium]|jgi:peptidyl-prolyl cis-trans isomerase SurA
MKALFTALLFVAAPVLAQTPAAAPAAPAPGPAQATSPELIDRVVAVVGDQAILYSEVNERLQQSRSSGMQIPEDSAGLLALQRQVLTQMVDEEVLYQKAKRDTSINVTDTEVQSAVDQQYHNVRTNFRTDQDMVTALHGAGWASTEEYRRFLTEQSRREAYRDRFLQKQRTDGKLRSGTISDREMRTFFDAALRSGQLDSVPPTITFRQIVIGPRPSDSAMSTAARLADSVKALIDKGADFAAMARRYSDDPGSRDSGGALGFFRRGMMVRPFEEMAFSLRPGIVSPPVHTEFGYHLIMVDRVQPGEVKARHILFAPVITAVEAGAARRLADSMVVLVRAGANMDSLARLYSDSSEQHVVGPTDRSQLPPGYAASLANVTVGEIVGPVALSPESPERTHYLVAKVTELLPKRLPAFEDVRELVRGRMVEQKGIQNLIADLRRETYVDTRL